MGDLHLVGLARYLVGTKKKLQLRFDQGKYGNVVRIEVDPDQAGLEFYRPLHYLVASASSELGIC